jgi:hypothetical protein
MTFVIVWPRPPWHTYAPQAILMGMRPWLLYLLLATPASAVEIPPDWVCSKKELGRHWQGMRLIDPKEGPNWGDKMDRVPTPFMWLVIYQHRDRDVAERRAPINMRWKEFIGREKCAYFKNYSPEATQRQREYNELVNWKSDDKLVKNLNDLSSAEIVAAQEGKTISSWRKRFGKMRLWLEGYGLKEGDSNLEAAQGIFVRLGRLKVAHLDFQRASGHFAALVRLRFDSTRENAAEFSKALTSQGATSAHLALLNSGLQLERVIEDLSEQMAQDPDNRHILGKDFFRRVAASLASIEREKSQRAHSAKVVDTIEQIAARKRAVKLAEAAVDKLEARLKEEKLLFPADADPQLLVSLEEYRRGRRELYPLAMSDAGAEQLEARYLGLLRNVCITHYKSIRYKQKLINLLCGKK